MNRHCAVIFILVGQAFSWDAVSAETVNLEFPLRPVAGNTGLGLVVTQGTAASSSDDLFHQKDRLIARAAGVRSFDNIAGAASMAASAALEHPNADGFAWDFALNATRSVANANANNVNVTPATSGIVSNVTSIEGGGLQITIRDKNGVETAYAHLTKLAVKPGDSVTAGITPLGVLANAKEICGSDTCTTKMWTGPHLHFAVYYDKTKATVTLDGNSLEAFNQAYTMGSSVDQLAIATEAHARTPPVSTYAKPALTSALPLSPMPVSPPFTVVENRDASGSNLSPATFQIGNNSTVSYRWTGVRGFTAPAFGPMQLLSGHAGVNFLLQKATVGLNFMVGTTEINIGTPFDSSGMPIIYNGNSPTFTGTFANSGRCSTCNSTATGPGSVDSFSYSGQFVNGVSGLSVAVSGVDAARPVSFTADFGQTPTAAKGGAVAYFVNGGGNAATFRSDGTNIDAANNLLSFTPPVGPRQGALGASASTVVGNNSSAGNLYWGRWASAGTVLKNNNYQITSGSAFWIHGDAPNTIPTNLGTNVIYRPVGGVNNAAGSTVNGGTVNVNFLTQNAALSNFSVTLNSGLNLTMSGSSGFSPTSGRFGTSNTTVTCSGACPAGTPTGLYNGIFTGRNAEGIGLAYSMGFGTPGVTGVHGFKR